jgi:hypothetical protein
MHRDHEQNFQADVLQVVAATRVAEQQQTQRGHRADGGHVVHDQVEVGEVHDRPYTTT